MLGSIFKALDIDYNNGLADLTQEEMSLYQRQFFNMAHEKLGIDAVYFLRDADGTPKTPLIYFSAMDKYDEQMITELHRLAWNLGEAPLLFIVTPEQLLIYNTYSAPKKKDGVLDAEAGLIDVIQLINDLETKRQLMQYHRLRLETGEFWRENEYRFDISNRVDTSLMNNLRIMRRILVTNIRKRVSKENLNDKQLISIVHALLGRSILTKYLEERTDKEGNTVFPADFFSRFKKGSTQYTDLLEDKDATYTLFKELADHFNGDMFPLINREYEIISADDLRSLQEFLLATTMLNDQQLALFPMYSFNVIPIQLISSIYELFFHLKVDDKSKKDGTYYTPYHLVGMLMDEVLPWEGDYCDKTILDPSCGSGIFLVEAYRRMVGRWIYTNRRTQITNEQLSEIMQKSIYGVDLNEEAVRIASFSLSLVMCDYMEPRSIWETLTFPRLMGYNLFSADFFSEGKFAERKYDIIIGNPPWESKLSTAAEQYVAQTKHPIGDKQIAQAFTWKAGEICTENGIICLLMPSKGFLFNRSEKNNMYRKSFFESNNVSVIINFSIFRKVLFEHATGPATAVIYSPTNVESHAPIFYCTPKPSFTIEDRRRFLIEPTDISKIPQDAIHNQLLWKIAMWGTPRDLDLINRIETKFKPVSVFIKEHEMKYAEGFIRGTKQVIECPEFLDWPLVIPKTFNAFEVKQEALNLVDFTGYYRCAQNSKIIFEAPHLLFKQSPKNGRFLSSVLNFDALFGNSFIGIHGDEKFLKYLSVVLYSKVFVYYSLMTSRRWLVERDELNVGELLSFPIPTPSAQDVEFACQIYDFCYNSETISESQIDEYAYTLYGLKGYEIEFVENAVDYVYDYFYEKRKSKALAKLKKDTQLTYQNVFIEILKKSLGTNDNISCNFYCGNAPLVVAQIVFNNIKSTTFKDNSTIEELLNYLDGLLLSERSGSVSIKRNVRVYNQNEIYIVKPNQSRYWSYSSACRDADEIYADIMRAWGEKYE